MVPWSALPVSEVVTTARLAAMPPPLRPPYVAATGSLPAPGGVAIVGSRKPERSAATFAHALAHALATRGVPVLSGGAVGIDAAAHEGALDGNGATYAVLPTGPDGYFPKANGDLFARIARSRGGLVFPFPPGTAPFRGHFLRRNGVLVALCQTVVVVQARIPSGALNAAAWARRLARPLYVVAGPPWDPAFAGSTGELLRGARPILSLASLLEELGSPSSPLTASNGSVTESAAQRGAKTVTTRARPRRESPPRAPEPLPLPFVRPASIPQSSWAPRDRDGDEESLLDALHQGPASADELVARTGLSAARVATALLTLRLDCVVVEGQGGFFRRIST
jgi:DNA processing protein